jgi:hypothetical protein
MLVALVSADAVPPRRGKNTTKIGPKRKLPKKIEELQQKQQIGRGKSGTS